MRDAADVAADVAGERTAGNDEPWAAVLAWGVQPLAVTRPEAGTMNEVLVIDSADGRLVLRGHRRRERELVELEHVVMEHVRAYDVPAPVAVRTPNGELAVWHADRWWSLLRWIEGTQPDRGEHTVGQAHAMGAMLGRIHTALREMNDPRPPGGAAERSGPSAKKQRPTAYVIEQIDQLITHIGALHQQGSDETAALTWLRGQGDWLRGRVDSVVPDADSQVVHGDYHDANVIFSDDTIAGVIDWDAAGFGEAAVEVVRAIHLSFGLDAARSRAFVDGYRSARPMPPEELELGAQRYGFRRDRSVWLFDELYRQGNERLRPLINDRPFVAFEISWAELMTHLR